MINSNMPNTAFCGVSLSYLFKDSPTAVTLSIVCAISIRKIESTNKIVVVVLVKGLTLVLFLFSFFLLGCHWSSWIERC